MIKDEKYTFPIYIKREEWKRKYVWLTLVDNTIIKIPKLIYKKWINVENNIAHGYNTRAKAEYFSVDVEAIF